MVNVEEIYIRYGSNISNMTFALVVGTVINGLTENTLIYENRHFREVSSFSLVENTPFKNPISELKTLNTLYSGFATVPNYIKGLRTLNYQDS